MALARINLQARKDDTRHKIQLGGLVIKSGLGDENKAVILGALFYANKAIHGDAGDQLKAKFKAVGQELLDQ